MSAQSMCRSAITFDLAALVIYWVHVSVASRSKRRPKGGRVALPPRIAA